MATIFVVGFVPYSVLHWNIYVSASEARVIYTAVVHCTILF